MNDGDVVIGDSQVSDELRQEAAAELESAERELAEQEQTLEARLQMAKRRSESLVLQIRQILEGLRDAEDKPLTRALQKQLQKLAVPALGLSRPLVEARAARMAALAARREAHAKIEGALAENSQLLVRLSRQVAELMADLAKQKATAPPAPAPAAPKATAPPPLPRPEDRRATPRVEFERTIDFASEDNFFTGFANDISTGGLFVATLEPPPRGTAVSLVFSLPDGMRIEAEGEVRWTREYNDRVPFLFPGAGIQFTRISKEAVDAISSFVAARKPLFYPD